MTKNTEKSPLKFFTVLMAIKKLSLRKLWIGLALNEDDAYKKVLTEAIKEFKINKKDITLEGICFVTLEESLKEINKFHNNLNKKDNTLSLPMYRAEKPLIKEIKIKDIKRKKTKTNRKNILMKEIINKKDKKIFKKNIKKFNKAEKKYIEDKLK